MSPLWLLIYGPMGLGTGAVVQPEYRVHRVAETVSFSGSERSSIGYCGSERSGMSFTGSERSEMVI